MAKWKVGRISLLAHGPAASPGPEILAFRVYPEGEPESWIAQTNPDLPCELQEETAILIAEALFNILGA